MNKTSKVELIGNIPELVKLSKLYSNINVEMLESEIPEPLEPKEDFFASDYWAYWGSLNDYIDFVINSSDDIAKLECAITTGKLLNHLIEKKKITSAELSKSIGVAPSSVSRWINGSTRITNENLKKIADYFNVSTDYLTGKSACESKELEDLTNLYKQHSLENISKYAISKLDKIILEECGYYLIDPFTNEKFYNCQKFEYEIYENQRINENSWISWKSKVTTIPNFPTRIALVDIKDLENGDLLYWNTKDLFKYTEEIKIIAQYVDYDKLKVLIEDRKNLLSFNFKKSLESIKLDCIK